MTADAGRVLGPRDSPDLLQSRKRSEEYGRVDMGIHRRLVDRGGYVAIRPRQSFLFRPSSLIVGASEGKNGRGQFSAVFMAGEK